MVWQDWLHCPREHGLHGATVCGHLSSTAQLSSRLREAPTVSQLADRLCIGTNLLEINNHRWGKRNSSNPTQKLGQGSRVLTGTVQLYSCFSKNITQCLEITLLLWNESNILKPKPAVKVSEGYECKHQNNGMLKKNGMENFFPGAWHFPMQRNKSEARTGLVNRELKGRSSSLGIEST